MNGKKRSVREASLSIAAVGAAVAGNMASGPLTRPDDRERRRACPVSSGLLRDQDLPDTR